MSMVFLETNLEIGLVSVDTSQWEPGKVDYI